MAAPCVSAQTRESHAEISAEYRVKAGFLFNFPQFVEWPESAFLTPQDPIVIGVLGDDPFGDYLDELVRGEKIGRRAVVVRRFARVEAVSACQILYLGREQRLQPAPPLTGLAGRSILTVGESEGFERSGGIIRFSIENGKVRLRVNASAAKASGLAISSKLLRLSTIVNPPKD